MTFTNQWIAIALVLAAPLAACDLDDRRDGARGADPANTVNNKRDAGDAVTPMDQSEHSADIQVTAEIRRALVADAGLSMDAKNVKIVTSSGVTVLRGVVDSDAEKTQIREIATGTAGVGRVQDDLEVKQTQTQ